VGETVSSHLSKSSASIVPRNGLTENKINSKLIYQANKYELNSLVDWIIDQLIQLVIFDLDMVIYR